MEEHSVCAADSPLVDPCPLVDPDPPVDTGPLVDPGPLVAVTFERNIHRKDKYLESEPKALGITQMVLSVFMMSSVGVFLSEGLSQVHANVVFFICSTLVLIAGGVAIAAEKLHLPTLRACLAMQMLSCVASMTNMICTVLQWEVVSLYCWLQVHNTSLEIEDTCDRLENSQSHFFAGAVLMEVALLAVSVTLTVYCCKVLNCCGPASKMPVITVQTAAVHQ